MVALRAGTYVELVSDADVRKSDVDGLVSVLEAWELVASEVLVVEVEVVLQQSAMAPHPIELLQSLHGQEALPIRTDLSARATGPPAADPICRTAPLAPRAGTTCAAARTIVNVVPEAKVGAIGEAESLGQARWPFVQREQRRSSGYRFTPCVGPARNVLVVVIVEGLALGPGGRGACAAGGQEVLTNEHDGYLARDGPHHEDMIQVLPAMGIVEG